MKKTIIFTILLICISCNCEQRETNCAITECNNDTIEKTIGIQEYREFRRKQQDQLDSIRILKELNKQEKSYCLGDTNEGI